MEVTPADLRAIPLFQGITDEHLRALIGVFERQQVPQGQVLFRGGEQSSALLLLVDGEVALLEGDQIRFRLNPVAPIGELGALTGLPRYTTAVAAKPSQVWSIASPKLMEFFEAHGDVAFPFYHNLLSVVSDKIRRDEQRLAEMRTNIVRTQKAMKRVRDLILESEDTTLSNPIYETLEGLIEQNRRWHYLVEPAHTLQAKVRLDDGTLATVRQMSDSFMRLESIPLELGADWSGVLVLPSTEIPISGTVSDVEDGAVLIKLDMLIDAYAGVLEDYLTRVQMLDFVV